MKRIKKIGRKIFPKKWHPRLKRIYSLLYNSVDFIRFQKPITKLLGSKYKKIDNIIEIDVTYDCNAKCINCCRSCRQAPTKDHMTAKQIKKFVDDSIKQKHFWKEIKIMGGEPTLNPEIFKILKEFIRYKKTYPKSNIRLLSNGLGKKTKEILKKVPKEIEIRNTEKEDDIQYFFPFNVAPKDKWYYKTIDYSNGCSAVNLGLNLNKNGFYVCPCAGAIDRVLGYNLGRKRIPYKKDTMKDQFKAFCPYCGFFALGSSLRVKGEKISKSWKKAYKNFEKEKPELKKY